MERFATDLNVVKHSNLEYPLDYFSLTKNEAISQCKVVDIEDGGNKTLAAHLVFQEGVRNKEEVITSIWNEMRKSLPPYMVPEHYKIRSSMPVHTNGKRDVGALREDKKDLISVERLY